MKRGYGIPVLLALCMAVFFCMPVPVRAETAGVFDDYGVLDSGQRSDLEQRIKEIYDSFQFETAFLITEDVGEQADYRQYAAAFMQRNDIGYGEEHNGLCVFHQPDARNITLVFRGEIQDAFSVRIQNLMLDNCTEELKEDDTYEAYCTILEDLEKGLSRALSGKRIRPVDISHIPVALEIIKWILISFGVAAVPTLLLTWYQRHRMITEVPRTNADEYTEEEGIHFQEMRDMFVHRTVARTRKHRDEDHHSGSHGSFTSGGERFSGSGRNY